MNDTITVYELRKRGWKVRCSHLRNINCYAKKNSDMNLVYAPFFRQARDKDRMTNGGKTTVEITPPSYPSSVVFVGHAKCSAKDQYCYKGGVKIALERALNDYKKSIYYHV